MLVLMSPSTALALVAVAVSCSALLGCHEILGLGDYREADVSGAGAGGAGGAGSGGGGSDNLRCGGMGVLVDDFMDEVLTEGWEDYQDPPNSTIAETNGELFARVEAATASEGIRSTLHHHDLRDDALVLEVAGIPTDLDAFAVLEILADDDNRVTIRAGNEGAGVAQLIVESRQMAMTARRATVTFDPTDHRFWRVRVDQSQLVVSAAPQDVDGDYTPYYTAASPAVLLGAAAVRARFGIWSTVVTNTLPQVARFASLHGGPPAGQRWCPASSLTDPFDDGVTGAASTAWKATSLAAECSVEENGQLVLVANPTMNDIDCTYASSAAYSLEDSSITVRLAEAAPYAGSSIFVDALVDFDTYLALALTDGVLTLVMANDGASPTIVTLGYDPAMTWWRLSESGGQVGFQASADGTNWTDTVQYPALFALHAVKIRLGLLARVGGQSRVAFTDLNAPP